jgi:hypothetical protein
LGGSGSAFGSGQCRQDETGENGNDGDDDEQFDEGEARVLSGM